MQWLNCAANNLYLIPSLIPGKAQMEIKIIEGTSKTPQKLALKLLGLLFTKEELKVGSCTPCKGHTVLIKNTSPSHLVSHTNSQVCNLHVPRIWLWKFSLAEKCCYLYHTTTSLTFYLVQMVHFEELETLKSLYYCHHFLPQKDLWK